MRVVIADDNLLVRAGVAALLQDAGIDVVAQCDDADALLGAVDAHRPDLAVVDIRMPPTQTDEGLRAAHEIRARRPGTAIVILSEHVEDGVAMRLLAERPDGLGYLLKRRVTDVDDFVDSIGRVAAGGTALDPLVVSRLLAAGHRAGPVDRLTPREREVLGLIAEGLSNRAIAQRIVITLRSAEKYVSSIFVKLGLPDTGDEHRRVLAVLEYLHG